MSFRSPARCGLCLALGAALLSLSALSAQTAKTPKADAGAKDKPAKGDSRGVSFRTSDGVELQGNFYPAPGSGAKDACVLMLHNFSARTGGDSHEENWDRLAAELQKAGYAVLTFDFRGFGKSKTVDKEFWNKFKNPQNQTIRNAARMPETIDRADFRSDYYPNLANDVAAAKAYLDRKNDGREVNASNLVVIGAGEGATVGALWMASELHRKKDRASLTPGLPPDLDQPEARDFTCAVWLSISPSLAGIRVPVRNWLVEVGRDQKVPMAFVYGTKEKDKVSMNFAQNVVSQIKPKAGSKKFDPKDTADPRAYTGEKKLDTSLSGAQLLQRSLDTEKWITKTYLADLFDARPVREWRKRDSERFAYVWSFPMMRAPMLAKAPGEETPRPLPLQLFFKSQ